jgi:hypothetical protein
MTQLVWSRVGRALVVTLSALTLARLLDLSHRTAALGVWLGVVLPAGTGSVPSGWERWRIGWETGHTVSFVLLLGFAAPVLAVLSERHPRRVRRLAGTGAIR